ncbi:MAG TPA: hypothetical protein VGI52_05685 [Solirubrobacteraceae bacterium]|jgi:hypothetical protein
MSAEQTREHDPSVAIPSKQDESTAGDAPATVRQGNQHGLSLAAHPRAARRVAECKAWGGLAGFFIGGYLSLSSNTLLDASFRALLTGIVCYVAVWGAAVFLWRRLIVAELRQREHELSSELARRAGLAGAPGDGDPNAAPVTS